MSSDLRKTALELLQMTLDHGADEADIMIQSGREAEVITRMMKTESIKEATSEGYGIRVFKDKRLGFCFSSDFSEEGLRKAAEAAVELSGETTADEFNGLPEYDKSFSPRKIELYDSEIAKIPMERKLEMCLTAEKTMFDFDKRITNSEGAAFRDGETTTIIVNSNGFDHTFRSSYCYINCKPVARQDGKLQSGWWFSMRRFLEDLESAERVGRIAAERTVRMLGARVPSTAKVPVVFDRICGMTILYSLLEAIDGDAIFKKASYLTGKIDEHIASPLVNIVDDPHLSRGPASAPFDAEGSPTSRREVVSSGVLRSYMYDHYTAGKAGTVTTGNAQRDSSSLPSIGSHNFYMEAGESSFEEIIGSVKKGLFLTGIMGSGVNPVTGDYSLGASGLWIENGKLSYPVEGITVASNMLEILGNIDMVGNDLEYMASVCCPTFRVKEMTVSGTA